MAHGLAHDKAKTTGCIYGIDLKENWCYLPTTTAGHGAAEAIESRRIAWYGSNMHDGTMKPMRGLLFRKVRPMRFSILSSATVPLDLRIFSHRQSILPAWLHDLVINDLELQVCDSHHHPLARLVGGFAITTQLFIQACHACIITIMVRPRWTCDVRGASNDRVGDTRCWEDIELSFSLSGT